MDVESGPDFEEDDEEYDYLDEQDGGEGRAHQDTHNQRSGGPGATATGAALENTVWNAADVTAEYHQHQVDDMVRPHAGTGGSSKMRSRPNNVYQV